MMPRGPAVIRSGLTVEGIGSETMGTLGLLVVDADARVSIITSATVLPAGTAAIPHGNFLKRTLAPSILVSKLDPGASLEATNLLVRSEVSEDVYVSSAVAGVDEPCDPVRPGHALGETLLLVGPTGRVPLGQIKAIGLTAAIRWPDGARRIYRELVEVARPVGARALPDGSAGGLVMTGYSAPVGILVGQLSDSVLIAPLQVALTAAELRPLDAYSAQEQCGRARDRAWQDNARPKPGSVPTASRDGETSEEMLDRHGIRELVRELEGA